MRCRALWIMAALVVVACGDQSVVAPELSRAPLAGGGVLAIGVDSVTGARIETNKDDYSPGEVVHLVGSGWAPGEVVNLFMSEEPDTHGDVNQNVVADSAGGFSLHFYDVQPHDLGVTFTLTATGQTSGSRAVAVFTDGQPQDVTLTPSTSAVVPSGTATYSVAVNMVGNSNACLVTLQVTTSLPTGATATFTGGNPVSLPAGSGNNDFTRELSIATTAATPVGSYPFTVLAERGTGCQGVGTGPTATGTLIVNHPPTADAGSFYTGNEGSAIPITGTATDPDNDALTTTWSFSSGGTGCVFANASALSTTVTCNDNGSHTLRLTVSDGKAAPVTSHAALSLNNVAPTATFTAPASAVPGVPFTISLDSPVDPSSADVAAGFEYAFDCGTGYGAFGTATSTSCTATSPATFTVKGTIRDKDGVSTEYTASVSVSNQPPTANAGGPYMDDEGTPIALDGSGNDPDGGTPTYLWSTNAPVGICTISNGTSEDASILCTDDDQGASWTVTLTVTDDEGASVSASASLDVANVAPSVTLNGPATANEGAATSYNYTFTDPGADTWTHSVSCGANGALSGDTFSSASKSGSFTCTWPDNFVGQVVSATVNDDDAGTGSATVTVNVNNVAPIVTLSGPTNANEGDTKTYSYTFTDPGTDSWTRTASCGTNGTIAYDTFNGSTKSGSFTCTWTDNYVGEVVTATVNDDDGGTGSDNVTVTINNVAPVVSLTGPSGANEGDTKSYSYTFTDPGADIWTHAVSCGANGTVSNDNFNTSTKAGTFDCTWQDNYLGQTVSATVTDDDLGAGTSTASVDIANVAPTLGPITVSGNIVAVGTAVTASASFTDPGNFDTHTGVIDWDDGTTSAAVISSGTASGSHAYTTPGVYTIRVTVTDDDGGADSEIYEYVVVYDPNGGFVTGGGWINSPSGAYPADPLLTGKATFGFVSKYQKGATTPTGNTEFQFHAAGLNFKSTSYQWLVVSGPQAQYKGDGTLNGVAGYGFILTAKDGQVSGGGGVDKFRIKITDSGGNVIYDNQMGAVIDAEPTTALGGGSIVIHTGKK